MAPTRSVTFAAAAFVALPLAVGRTLLRASGPAPGPAPGPAAMPPATDVVTNFDKKWRPLPSQGYDERSKPEWVVHEDHDTKLGDWMSERPRRQGETEEGDSTTRACKEHPEYLWCNLWLKDRGLAGRKYSGGKKVAQAAGQAVADAGNAVSDTSDKATDNLAKAMENTGEQGGEAADDANKVLPPGMSPSQKDIERQQEEAGVASGSAGKDYPPGMVSEEGSKSPHGSLAFSIEQPQRNLTNMW